MFNQRDRRTGKTTRTTGLKKSTAILGAVGVVGGLLLAAPTAASADTNHASYAQGKFLSGSLAGMDLARVVQLTPATARNNGAQSKQEVVDPLAVSLLGTTPINVGSIRVNPDNIVDTSTTGGALSQYARAEKSGEAMGASGTIGQGGSIGPNASNPGDAFTLSFDSLLNDTFDSVIQDLRLEIQAIAAQAKGTPQSVSGDYYIDGLTLRFTSPAIAGLAKKIQDAVAAADGKLDSLTGANGELALALNAVLKAVNPALDLLGDANVSVSLTTDLQAAIADLVKASYGGQGVSFDLETGEVTVDLSQLVGGNLNNRPVNTELLTGAAVTRIVSTIGSNVDELADQVIARVKLALQNARLDVDADLKLLTEQAPLLNEVCQWQDAEGNILSELLGKLLGKLVCTTTTTVLPKLETSVAADVHGTVSQVLDGSAPATVAAKVLGVPVAISTDKLLSALDGVLGDKLFGGGGVLSTLTGLLDGPLLAQVNQGLLGSTSVTTVLNDLLSIKVNLQETTLNGGGGMAVATGTLFTQTALRVSVARGAGNAGPTTLNLAAASVAPVLPAGTDPGDDPGEDPGDDPGDNPGDDPGDNPGDDPGSNPTAGPDNLAYTGVGIGALIAALLAALAAGAWLVREGYRRNHPTLEP